MRYFLWCGYENKVQMTTIILLFTGSRLTLNDGEIDPRCVEYLSRCAYIYIYTTMHQFWTS
jgi:hypothetical protein